ncbi:MAG: alpha-mannosidase [Kiritimatiellia bacterium]|jgi:alpha-mannosidase
MAHFYPDIHIARLKEVYNRLAREIIIETAPLSAVCSVTPEPVPYARRLELPYSPITVGAKWGATWDCGWFHITGEVPAAWKGACVTLNLDFTGEALVYDAEGCPLVGLTTGSVFDAAYNKDMVHVAKSCQGGEKIDYWVETGANGLFGVNRPGDPAWVERPEDVHGHFNAEIKRMRICRFDYDKWQLRLDLEVVIDLVETLAPGAARRMQVLRIASRALDSLPPERGGAAAAREALRPVFELPTDPATLDVGGIGHAHIDTAWLWPERETVRKVARTFASQIGLIERYPGYKFGASQPQLYLYCKEHYPALYEKVKQAVADGNWELQGGMWVEADCNIPSGESLVRQILLGRNFFRDEFGVEVKNIWIPDVFGYSANLPQIIKTAGVDFFLTQKISWNRHNKFPHNTFIWQGVDGSEVLAHFPPEDDYNSQVKPSQLRKHETNNSEAGLIDDAICLYGIGNGGGGPKEEHVERALRCHNLNGCPRFHFSFAQDVLERMATKRDELDTWIGELYLEMHRATLTSQAAMKRWNRRAEEALRAAEMLCAAADIDTYPAEAFNTLWQTVLYGHFHDIIPGSSIHRVYQEHVPALQDVVATCKRLQDEAAATLLADDDKALTLFNPSSTPFSGTITLPENWRKAALDGADLPVQREADDYVAWVDVPARGFVTLALSSDEPAAAETASINGAAVLENDEVRYVIDSQMRVVSCFDKTLNAEFIPEGQFGNAIELFDDYPTVYDAWDYEEYADDMKTAEPKILTIERIDGPVRSGVMAVMKLGESTFLQTAWLGRCGKRLDFVTNVDWKEKHKLARVSFPVAVRAQKASFEIPYATCERDTHDNTRWQYAQFEVVGHRYADLSEPDRGVALLNDSKYGYRVKGNVLSLSLLRAPTHPDPVCDVGQHHFTYSLLPHVGGLAASDDVVASASILNQGLETFLGKAVGDAARLPVAFEGDGVELAVLKRAEKEDCLVVRLAERRGRKAVGVLSATDKGASFVECPTSEWTDIGKPLPAPATIAFRPFELKTFKLRIQ